MNSVGVRSITLTELSSAIAVGCMGSVLGAGSVLKIKSILWVSDGTPSGNGKFILSSRQTRVRIVIFH